MASTFLTLPTPFLHKTNAISFSNKRLPCIFNSPKPSFVFTKFNIFLNFLTFSHLVLQRNSLKINAIAKKWEPTKRFLNLDLVVAYATPLIPLSFPIFDDFGMQVVPQADRVLVRLEELSDKTVGGVLLPKSAVKFERYLVGEILTVGSEAGELKAGTKVLFTDINAYEVDLGTDAKHCFCKASDLLAVVE
ncbi:10 kDa chaperonin 1, chloroplastic, partial [Mucuna pruriens]